jgi:hypothetical protein
MCMTLIRRFRSSGSDASGFSVSISALLNIISTLYYILSSSDEMKETLEPVLWEEHNEIKNSAHIIFEGVVYSFSLSFGSCFFVEFFCSPCTDISPAS